MSAEPVEEEQVTGKTDSASSAPAPLMRVIRDQRTTFLIIGVTNTVIGFAVFAGFELTLGRFTGYLVVLAAAHVCCVLIAFILYRWVVFRVRGNVLRDLGRFELVYLTSLGVNVALLPVLVEWGGLDVLVAQASIVVITAAISFFGHKHFSFRRSDVTL